MDRDSEFRFIAPNKIEEYKSLRSATIGVIDCDPTDADSMLNLSLCATPLLNTDIHFFSFALVVEGKTSLCVRMSRHYLETLIDIQNGIEISEDNWATLLPMQPTEAQIKTLPGVSLNSVNMDSKDGNTLKVFFEVWHLLEYRKRLDIQSDVEQEWLREIEAKYVPRILKELDALAQEVGILVDEVKSFVLSQQSITEELIIAKMFELVMYLNDANKQKV